MGVTPPERPYFRIVCPCCEAELLLEFKESQGGSMARSIEVLDHRKKER